MEIPLYALRYSSTCAHTGLPTETVLSLTDIRSSVLPTGVIPWEAL